jgi:V/A-type H+-transporting ATPase subunit K
MFMIINKLPPLEAARSITIGDGLAMLSAALPVAVTGFLSAIYQGKVCAAGCSLVAKRPGEVGKAMVFGVVVETYAVLGLLATILLLQRVSLGG